MKAVAEPQAVTVKQPFASLVGVGAKTLLDRAGPLGYRGRLLIHAALETVDLRGVCIWQKAVEGRTDLPAPVTPMGNLPLGKVVASCVLVDCVPVVGSGHGDPERHRTHIGDYPHDGPLAHQQGGLWLIGFRADGCGTPTRIEDQRPFGDFSPGRFVWLLDDVKPTTERCPRCWGWGFMRAGGVDDELNVTLGPCPTCKEAQVCPPVPMRGHPGLWTPTW